MMPPCLTSKKKRDIHQIKSSKYIESIGIKCRTPSTIEMRYRLIPPCTNYIVNTLIKIKPRLRTRFSSNIRKCAFVSPSIKLRQRTRQHINRRWQRYTNGPNMIDINTYRDRYHISVESSCNH